MQEAALHLLARAADLGIALWPENGELRYRCAKGSMPRDFAAELRAHKPALLAELLLREPVSSSNELAPAFRSMPKVARVPSFRQVTWDLIKSGRTGRDSSNCHFVVRVRAELDHDIFAAACRQLLDRHDVLQVVVEETAGRPWLLYGSRRAWQAHKVDLLHVPEEDREAAAREAASAIVWEKMDPSTDPLFKAFAIKLAQDHHVFGIVTHHFISDAATLRLLMNEISQNYAQLSAGRAQSNDPDPFQYRDYLLTMEAWFAEPEVRSQLSRWTTRLAAAPPMDLRLPHADWQPAQATVRQHVEIDAELADAIERTARALQTTPFMILLTAQKIVLAHMTGEREVVMGGVTQGRERPILEPVVGYLADRIFWVTRFNGNPTFIDALATVQAAVAEAMHYQFLRSDLLVTEFSRQSSRLIAPIFNFMPRSSSQPHAQHRWLETFTLAPAPTTTTPMAGISYWFMLQHGEHGMRGYISWQDGIVRGFLPRLLGVLDRVTADQSCTLTDTQQCWRAQ